MRSVLVIACVVGCGKGSGDSGSGTTSAPAAGGGNSDCTKAVELCTAVAASHVDALCGTKSPKTVPTSAAPPYQADGCSYKAENDASNVSVSRICIAGGAGVEQVKAVFKGGHDSRRENEVHTDLGGMGDEAYIATFRHDFRELFVRSGNTLIQVQHSLDVPAEAEDKLAKDCLIALYREVAAKY